MALSCLWHSKLYDACDITGFMMLEQEDQIKLFKQGSFELAVTWYTLLMQPDGMFTPHMEKKIPR